MTRAHRKTGVARLAALALGAVLALAPFSASALTIGVRDLATGTEKVVTSEDTNEVSIIGETLGGTDGFFASVVTLQLAFFTDANGRSTLSLTGSATAGSGGLFIDAFHTGFGAGAGLPTYVNFQSSAREITSGALFSAGFVNADDTGGVLVDELGDLGDFVGGGILASSSTFINVRRPFDLGDPFAMSITNSLLGGTILTGLDARLTAAVPLPAAGWLMIAGLGGLAALRRRRRAA